MPNAEDFRSQGLKCLGLAREASNLRDRLRWLDMAQYWFSRADALEQAPSSDAQRQGDYRIRSFHHV
jgi:hypothetical protein